MKKRLPAAVLVAALVALFTAAGAGAALIGIGRNDMNTASKRAQVIKLTGGQCERGGSNIAFKVELGKRTKECTYRTSVVGRDLEIAATTRLLSGTPKRVRGGAYLAVNVRAGGSGARYQLRAFPLQDKAQLRKVMPDGKVEFLAVEQKVKVRDVNRANVLRLRAFNFTGGKKQGQTQVAAWVGKKRIGGFTDKASGLLKGRSTGFTAGSVRNGTGLVASFDDVVIRLPSPF